MRRSTHSTATTAPWWRAFCQRSFSEREATRVPHLLALGHASEAVRQGDSLVAVGHPDHLGAACGAKQLPGAGVHRHAPVLTLLRWRHDAAQALHNQLHAVADAQDGHPGCGSPLKEARRHRRRPRLVHAVGPARQDHHAGVRLLYASLGAAAGGAAVERRSERTGEVGRANSARGRVPAKPRAGTCVYGSVHRGAPRDNAPG